MHDVAGNIARTQIAGTADNELMSPEWQKAVGYLPKYPDNDKAGVDTYIFTHGIASLQAKAVRLVPVDFTDDAQNKLFHRMHVMAELDCAKGSDDWMVLRHHMPLHERDKCRAELQQIQDDGGHADFIMKDNKPVGCAIYYPCLAEAGSTSYSHISMPGRTSRHAYLHLIGLNLDVRGQGIGKVALKHIEETLAAQGCDNVTLAVAEIPKLDETKPGQDPEQVARIRQRMERNGRLIGWYEAQGWKRLGFGILPGYDAMRKRLQPAAPKL